MKLNGKDSSKNHKRASDDEPIESPEDVFDIEEEGDPEPEEDDIFFGDERGKTVVSHAHKVIGTFTEEEEAITFIKDWMDKNKYWPNVWFVSDHGNMHLMTDIYKSDIKAHQSVTSKKASIAVSDKEFIMSELQVDEPTAQRIIRLTSRPLHYEKAVNVLKEIDDLIEGSGVEAVRTENAHVDNYYFDIVATYVNTGDTYSTTIVHDSETGEFLLTSWGDFYEGLLQEHPEYDPEYEDESMVKERLSDNIRRVALGFFEQMSNANIISEEEYEELTYDDKYESLLEFIGDESMNRLIQEINSLEQNSFGDALSEKEDELAAKLFNEYLHSESNRKDKELSDAGQGKLFE